MNPDEFQQAWRTESSQTRVTIDADLLRNEVLREQQSFRTTIFWRDFSEVAIALLLVPLWFVLGAVTSSPWTWYLTVPVLIWMAGFMLVYRKRHMPKPSEPGEPLLECVRNSLIEAEAQIWLLRNIFWWYLLPPSLSIMAFFVHVCWLASTVWWEFLGSASVFGLVLFAIYGFIYWLNQRAVRAQLEPRRRELLALLASLQDETSGKGADDHIALPALPFGETKLQAPCASGLRVVVLLGFVVIMLLVAAMVIGAVNTDPYRLTGEGYPLRSPFAAVRWRQTQPEVKVGKEWFLLVSLDELPASEIVEFSQRTYGDKWRKRFEEDLVELLTRMGNPPENKVTLVVQSLTSPETRTLEHVRMTYANRQAIRNAAHKRAAADR